MPATYATPAEVTIDNPAGRIVVTADDSATAVTVSVSALNPDDPAATDTASTARIAHNGRRLTIDTHATPRPGRAHGPGVVITGAGSVIAGVIGGTGNTGAVIHGASVTTNAATNPPALLITVTVPADIRVRVNTVTAAVTTHGWIRRVDVDTMSGPVDIAAARTVDVTSVTGPVRVTVTENGSAVIDTVSADVDIHTPAPVSVCDVRTVTGRVRRTGIGE